MIEKSFNCVTISSSALQNNYNYISDTVGRDVKVMAMVKADAYGHGMVKAAKAFTRAGCDVFGVAELREAVILRKAGVAGEIFVTLGFHEDDVDLIFRDRLTPVIYTHEAARALSNKATALGQEIGVHIKADTGMSRLGGLPHDLPGFLDSLSTMDGVKISGIMSHFPEADDPASDSTQQGYKAFAASCSAMKKQYSGICHIANSGAVLNFPNTYCDMVRAGIALYGYHPAGKTVQQDDGEHNLIPAMSFTTKILQVKTLPAGTGISYGHTFRTKKTTRLAILPVGYEDGFSRLLSNNGYVLIHGRRVPVRGRVCMNMCMVDITGIEGVKAGDEAVLLGRQGDATITADDLAAKMESISYEVLCLLGNNNNRIYIE